MSDNAAMIGEPTMYGVRDTRMTAPLVLLRFVIKKHASKYLHYDFRLEINGVLMSFVIYEGPSIDPAVPRRAIHVNDHSLGHLASERLIPEGCYGAGPQMVWDIGMYACCEDPLTAFQKGRLEFDLYGKRLRGRWILTYQHGPDWKLSKMMDDYAQPGNPDDLICRYDVSVITGRTMDEIRWNKPINENEDAQLSLWLES